MFRGKRLQHLFFKMSDVVKNNEANSFCVIHARIFTIRLYSKSCSIFTLGSKLPDAPFDLTPADTDHGNGESLVKTNI
jgi:hypothetical protein